MGAVAWRTAVALGAVAVPLLLACPLSLDDYTQGYQACAPDCGVSSIEAGVDAAQDGALGEGADEEAQAFDGEAATGCTPISTGAVSAATGQAQQTHLVYATNGARWWLFYIDDDTSSLKALWSTDFCQWNTPAGAVPIVLPYSNGGEGRNFSVAYKNIANTDVIHVAFSHRVDNRTRYRTHTRLSLAGPKLVVTNGPDTVTMFVFAADASASAGTDPDGPVTIIDDANFVTDFSGWVFEQPNVYGDANSWRSSSPDLGSSWSPGFAARQGIGGALSTVNARGVVTLAPSRLLAMWAFAPPVNGLFWSTGLVDGGWALESILYDAGPPQDVDDWSLCRVADNDANLVRRTSVGLFNYLHFDGSSWTLGSSPSSLAAGGPGVFLRCSAGGLALYAIVADGSIQTASLSGGTWSGWTLVVPAGTQRQFLAGYSSIADGKGGLVWTEGPLPFRVVGTPLP